VKAASDFGQVSQCAVKFLDFLPDKVENMGARAAPRPLDLDDFLDLVEVEAESPRLSDEGKDRQNVRPVDAVASLRPPRRGENPGPLVEPERLAADPAPGGDFADQQAISSHAWSLNPVPGVKVKGFLQLVWSFDFRVF
jgi:hypothetical protein